uniref:V-set and immunoglobulin domain-containing protein 10-like n=1 Tax=Oncorhynchus gorbuscha TaxID=8017 RepID=UPI001EAF8080|nr:V-set and immunoglobulin domain-containing protein 10-like [Oncorhynchus gorbuscha]
MNLYLLPVVLSLAVFLSVALSQDLVSIQFKSDPVLVQTGTDAVFTVVTVFQVFSITWGYPGGVTPLGLWVGGSAVLNTVTQYQGRVTITATQLRISSAQLRDAGNYTVMVDPLPTTGLAQNTRSIQLRVFDAVDGVTMFVPSVALEGGNVSVRCTWTKGTETSVLWGKGGSALTSNSRVTIKGGDLVINPARREDAGLYSCTVSNLVSAQTASKTLTVYYGPDTPVLSKASPADCVVGADAVVGQTIRLTCVSDSLPPPLSPGNTTMNPWRLANWTVACSASRPSPPTRAANTSAWLAMPSRAPRRRRGRIWPSWAHASVQAQSQA